MISKSNKIKHALASLGAAIIVLALTACQGIPLSSQVQEGLDDFSQTDQQVIYRPDMPVPDASQEEIVRGFLQAASSAADDYQIARQFLATRYQDVWDPYASVLVDEGPRTFSQTSPTHAQFSLNAIAEVDSTGAMVQLEPDKQTEIAFELVKQSGQWRIQGAPNGVILDRTTFRDVWSQQQLYFWGSKQNLVADNRWFLNRATVTTQIVEQLISGPRKMLVGAVTNAFPYGTALATDAVLVEAGQAIIDVTSEIFLATPEQLENISAQLAVTLNMVPGVSEFQVTVNNAPVISGSTSADRLNPQTNPADVSQWPALARGDEYGFLSPSGFIVDREMTEGMANLDPNSFVVTENSREKLVLNDDGINWVHEDENLVIDERSKLLEPVIDSFGYVWSMARNNPEAVLVTLPGDEQFEIDLSWLKGMQLRSFKVSPDANKIAFLVTEHEKSNLLISGILRDETGRPYQVVDAIEKSSFWITHSYIDMDWVDGQRVAVLGRVSPSSTRLTIGGLGIFPEERPGVQNAISLHGSSRTSQMLVLSDEGDLFSPQGSTGWQRQLSNVTLLSKRS